MEMYFEAKLPDVPGALIKILKPISEYNANITEIVHIRERRQGNVIPVGFYVTMDSKDEFQLLIKGLKEQGFEILGVKDLKSAYEITYILIGHVFESDITSMIKKIFSISGTMVKDVHAKIRSVEEYSTVSFTVGTERKENIKTITTVFDKLAKERKLHLIRPLESK
ncbi:MAG: ACT domain-containing protein [Promethearchaeota archaeon]